CPCAGGLCSAAAISLCLTSTGITEKPPRIGHLRQKGWPNSSRTVTQKVTLEALLVRYLEKRREEKRIKSKSKSLCVRLTARASPRIGRCRMNGGSGQSGSV